jgi:hypothetical protein
MAYFPHQDFKRRGAKQTAICDLCGKWVDVQDLILCDVEGFRGYYVCSSHPWEKKARVNPSFNDRGGVGQMMDPGHDFLPAPGGGGPFGGGRVWTTMVLDSTPSAVSSAASASNFADPNLINSDMTVELMVLLDVVPVSSLEIVSNRDPGTNQGWRIVVDTTNALILRRAAQQAATVASVFTLGSMQRVSLTHSAAGAVQFYINGAAVTMAQSTIPTTPTISFDWPIGIGNVTATGAWNSPDQVADLRVFNIVRTAAQIETAWNSTLPVDTDGLVGLWTMTEGMGTTLMDQVNGNDMTITGGLGWSSQTVSGNFP